MAWKKQKSKEGLNYALLSAAGIITLLAVWQLVVSVGLVNERMLPAPTQIFETLMYKFANKAPDGNVLWVNILASLQVALSGFLAAIIIGVPLGLVAGYYKGIWETIVMRAADIFMSFPSMILVLVLVSVIGPSVWTVTLVIGVLGWTDFAKLIYGNVLSVREKEYVESAKAVGTRDLPLLLKYVVPNAFAPILINFTFRTAQAIIQESALSFLGMGVQPPQASWGNILYAAQSITVLSSRPWLWVPPGILLVLTVSSINFVGDGIRDALDSKTKIKKK